VVAFLEEDKENMIHRMILIGVIVGEVVDH
jgi:hypothetical protein